MLEYTRSVEFQVGDLVVTPDGAGEVFYIQPTDDTSPTLVDVRVVAKGVRIYADFDLTLVEQKPAPGQQWRCLTCPDLTVTVRSVEQGGLVATCELPSGKVTSLILPGNYELVEEANR